MVPPLCSGDTGGFVPDDAPARGVFEGDCDCGINDLPLFGDRPVASRTPECNPAGGGGGKQYRAEARGHLTIDPGSTAQPWTSTSQGGMRSRLQIEHAFHRNKRKRGFAESRANKVKTQLDITAKHGEMKRVSTVPNNVHLLPLVGPGVALFPSTFLPKHSPTHATTHFVDQRLASAAHETTPGLCLAPAVRRQDTM